jgi:hypothetical protein
MPIVSNTFVYTTQADGRMSYVLRMYDQDGTERMLAGLLPAGHDTAGFVTAKIVEADVQLAEDEFRALVGL